MPNPAPEPGPHPQPGSNPVNPAPQPAPVPTPTPGETHPGTHEPNSSTPGHEQTPGDSDTENHPAPHTLVPDVGTAPSNSESGSASQQGSKSNTPAHEPNNSIESKPNAESHSTSEYQTHSKPKQNVHENSDQSKPAKTKPESSSNSAVSAPAKPSSAAPTPTAPATVQQLKSELRGTLLVRDNNVANAGVVNKVNIRIQNGEFIERLNREGIAYAYAYIYSSPRLLKGSDGSKYVTVRMVNGVPQFDAIFPAGYSGKHTVLLVDESGKQIAWTEVTVVDNGVSKRGGSMLQTGSNIVYTFALFIILTFVAAIARYKVAFR